MQTQINSPRYELQSASLTYVVEIGDFYIERHIRRCKDSCFLDKTKIINEKFMADS